MEIRSVTYHQLSLSNEELLQLKTLLDLVQATRSLPQSLAEFTHTLSQAAEIALDSSSTSLSVSKGQSTPTAIELDLPQYNLHDYTIKVTDDFLEKVKKVNETYKNTGINITTDKPILDTTI